MLEEIISSKSKRKLLTIFLTRPHGKFYLRELQRLTGEPVRAIQRELPKLEKIGLLRSEYDGQRKNYFVDKKCPIYEELKQIFLKTAAVGNQIKSLIGNGKDIKYAFIYGSTAKGADDLKSDIDLMVIGNIDEIKINNIIHKIESKINRTINYNLMDLKEFKKKIKDKNPFLKRVLEERKIDLIGSADEIR
jgi:predicted nucleotidyltransferase